jgi:hypothetical protein
VGLRFSNDTDLAPVPRRYNIRVPDPTPQDDHKHHRHAVYASETTGLLLIALLLMILTLLRYWHDIHWSLR